MENIDLSLVNWSRGQFALTAMYHWMFVPLTLGLGYIMAIMETIYVSTGKEEWKRIAKFWMTLFAINFVVGAATGIILEFEFGTNWSNYSYFVGDIFGAPLAIEGILAFFLESTFIVVMLFGWNRVSKKFHLASTWLVAFGANLSALWILVANGWMNYPAGMHFNPDTLRNEMVNFWNVILSPFAVNKFLHTISSGFVLSALFVIGISSWYLLKKREIGFAKKSIAVAAVFGLLSSIFLILTGDGSAKQVAQRQPMKFAAMEGLYEGKKGQGLIVIGAPTPDKKYNDDKPSHLFTVEIPKMLSWLGFGDTEAFVPGIKNLIEGGYEIKIDDNTTAIALPFEEKVRRGKIAIQALSDYHQVKNSDNDSLKQAYLTQLGENFQYFGYGYFTSANQLIPHVPILFYSFRIMVGLGFLFLFIFIYAIYLIYRGKYVHQRWFSWVAIFSIPLAYLAGQAGWIVAELGRQPWVIQDIMPTMVAVSRVDVSAVQITFWLFALIFTLLLIAEIRIMLKQIKIGPKMDGGQ